MRASVHFGGEVLELVEFILRVEGRDEAQLVR
jgi:hypothetical protein